jgi:hypothetical protein
MTDEVRRVLVAAGWYENRHVSIDEDLSALTAEGYAVWPELLAFLREFSGLNVRTVDGLAVLEIGASLACTRLWRHWADKYEAEIGRRLAPVGYYSEMAVMAAEDGRFYGGFDDLFGALGDCLTEMLTAILKREGQPLQRLYEL